ncbi:MAG: catalase KatE [Idiomarinaceae bacterium HL-53]|nr:MAG: catalase KatE [Idiomarinaceae bacterium HL-53]CUS48022.1 catalase [Idiomarinaceae bacterium HL-53]
MLLRYGAIALVVGVLGVAVWAVNSGVGQSYVTAQKFVNLQEGGNPHAGFRRAHAKGFCIAGEFVANGSLTEFSSAEVFAAGSTPFTGRISIAGNNPTAPDMRAPVRSLALSFGSGSDTWRTAMNTPPVMAVGTPEAFYEQIIAISPDPETGQRNPERIQAFFANHPETQAFREWQAGYTPSQSFATERYHSINAFYLVNEQGAKIATRWAAVPAAVTPTEALTELDAENPEALEEEFRARVNEGAVVFDFVFTLASDSDNENDPTKPWPENRPQRVAGQLFIRNVSDQAGSACNEINFDPLILPTGMAATADPILRARSAAYAESYRRRAREVLTGAAEDASHE